MSEIFFSIITVTFNSRNTIKDNIDSVKKQTYRNYEHLIIDNLSSDGTSEIIKENLNNKIIYIREKDNGCYEAMNKGINLSKGKWIHILNSDDYYQHNKVLLEATKVLKENKLNYFKINFLDISTKIIRNYSWEYSKYKMYIKASIPHPTMIISKKQYNKVGLYNTDFQIASDHDLTLKLIEWYYPIEHDFTLVTMRSNGLSRRNPILVASEFRDVTIKNGFSKFLAYALFYLRVIKFFFKW